MKKGDIGDARSNGFKEEIRTRIAKGLKETRGELGGLSRSVSYGFENEAYRMLPAFLKKNYGIAIKEKLVRAEIGGKEINIFGRAKRNGEAAIVVGEVKLRLDDRKKKGMKEDVFAELEDKVEAVRQEYRVNQIVRILVTHYATKAFVKKAQDRDVLVVQNRKLSEGVSPSFCDLVEQFMNPKIAHRGEQNGSFLKSLNSDTEIM